MPIDNKFPLANGVLCNSHLIIPFCPICGAAHTHGHMPDEVVGSCTTRCPHCIDPKKHTIYIINIIKKVDMPDYKKLMKRFEKPLKTMPVPVLITFDEAKRRCTNA